MEVILRAEGIKSGYEGVQILWGVDLEIPDGRAVVLLGPNGAGKTTLLRTLLGLLPLWSGRIEFAGNDISRLATEKRVRSGIAFMSELGVFPDLNLADNLRMGGYFLRRSEMDQRISKMYELFPDLARLRRNLAGSLSGGQRKMLGFKEFRNVFIGPVVDEDGAEKRFFRFHVMGHGAGNGAFFRRLIGGCKRGGCGNGRHGATLGLSVPQIHEQSCG